VSTTSDSISILNRRGETEILYTISEISNKINDVFPGVRINAYGERINGKTTIKTFEIVR
jgi:hypothetical protein